MGGGGSFTEDDLTLRQWESTLDMAKDWTWLSYCQSVPGMVPDPAILRQRTGDTILQVYYRPAYGENAVMEIPRTSLSASFSFDAGRVPRPFVPARRRAVVAGRGKPGARPLAKKGALAARKK